MKRKNIFGEFAEAKHKNLFSEKFSIPKVSTAEELRKLKIQENHDHKYYMVVCSCGKILGSELHFSPTPPVQENEIVL